MRVLYRPSSAAGSCEEAAELLQFVIRVAGHLQRIVRRAFARATPPPVAGGRCRACAPRTPRTSGRWPVPGPNSKLRSDRRGRPLRLGRPGRRPPSSRRGRCHCRPARRGSGNRSKDSCMARHLPEDELNCGFAGRCTSRTTDADAQFLQVMAPQRTNLCLGRVKRRRCHRPSPLRTMKVSRRPAQAFTNARAGRGLSPSRGEMLTLENHQSRGRSPVASGSVGTRSRNAPCRWQTARQPLRAPHPQYP